MGSVLDSFTSLLTPQTADRIGTTTGVAPNHVARGLGIIGPLVAGRAARSAGAPGGLHGMLALVPSGINFASPACVDAVLRSVKDPGVSNALVNGVFGAGQGAINRCLLRVLAFDASSLLRIGALLMLGTIARQMREANLDEPAMLKLLQQEQRQFFARADVVSRTVKEALVAGEEAAALRQRYTPHEWATARLAPLAAAQVVMMASPSGVGGATTELVGATDEIRRARGSAVPASLVGVLFDGELSRDEVQYLEDRQVALSVVKEGIAAVKANTPSEARNYGHLLVDVAIRTAQASKEGSFLGLGATRLTREEQDAIDAIRVAAEVR
jgi:hypothetical protein